MIKRLNYFDIAKGIGIISVIIGHVQIDNLNNFIYSFHMPLFFIISGYFLKGKDNVSYIKKQFKSLLIPYFVTSLIMMIISTLSICLFNKITLKLVENNVLYWIQATFYGSGYRNDLFKYKFPIIGATWFLLALFTASIITNYFMDKRGAAVYISGIALLGYFTAKYTWLPLSIQAGMTSSFFVYIGVLSRKYELFNKKLNPSIIIFIGAIWFLCIKFNNGLLYLVSDDFRIPLYSIIGALTGCFMIIKCSQVIDRLNEDNPIKNLLIYFGTNSLIVLCIHIIELNTFKPVYHSVDLLLNGLSLRRIKYIKFFIKVIIAYIGVELVSKVPSLSSIYNPKIKRTSDIMIKKLPFKKRLKYLDIAKGIAILLIIFGHFSIKEPLREIIFSFHMPMFIIVSGYFFKRDHSIYVIMKNGIIQLILPYLYTLAAITLIKVIQVNQKTTPILPILKRAFISALYGISYSKNIFTYIKGVDVVWFLSCLFFTKIIYTLIYKISCKFKQEDILCSIAVIISAFVGYRISLKYFLPHSIDVSLVSVLFFHTGYMMKKYNFLNKAVKDYTIILSSSIVWILIIYMGGIELAERKYPFIFLSMGGAIAGSFVFIYISTCLERFFIISKMLAFFGENSLYMLCLHCVEKVCINWSKIFGTHTSIIKMFIYKILIISLFIFIIKYIKRGSVYLKNYLNDDIVKLAS